MHVHVEAGTPARNCASRSSPRSHVPTTGAAATSRSRRLTPIEFEATITVPASRPRNRNYHHCRTTNPRGENHITPPSQRQISHAANLNSARHPCRVTGRPGRTQLSLHCLRGPCSVVGVASHRPAASPTCSRSTTTWFSIQLQRVNVHRDGVFGVDVTGVAIVLLERPREVGDLHHQPRAPGGGRLVSRRRGGECRRGIEGTGHRRNQV